MHIEVCRNDVHNSARSSAVQNGWPAFRAPTVAARSAKPPRYGHAGGTTDGQEDQCADRIAREPDAEDPAVGAGAHAPLQHGKESGRHVGGE